MEIKFPFTLSYSQKFYYLLENGFTNNFSLKHKIYYRFLRPSMSNKFRKVFQKLAKKSIKFNKDFIYENLINQISIDEINKFKYFDAKEFAIVLTHDVEEQEGFNYIPRLIELENKYGFKSSYNIVPFKYKIDEGIINLIKTSGNEIGIHGYNHDGLLYYSEKIFNERAAYINVALKKFGAVGFRSPMVHRNLYWLQRLDILYDASCFDYDPFQPFPGGTGSIWPFIVGKFVELPYTLPQDHTLFFVLKLNNIDIWKRKTLWIRKNRGVVLMLTHPDYIMINNNIKLYEEMLDFLNNFRNEAWYCLPKELAKWWKEKFD